MKKILSIAIALVMMMSVVALVACDNTETFTGEYSYTSYGYVYGAKVDVVMKGDTISNLRLYTDEETGWVGLSDAYPDYGWTDEARQVWLDGANNLMLSFVGMTADEVADISATIGGVNGDSDVVETGYFVSGATQSSARLVLAIQNAICGGPSTSTMTYTGSYSYDSYGSTYGVKLDVTLTGCLISDITLYSDTETGWVSLSDAYPDYGWTEDNRDNWTDNLDKLLESFYGMSADEVGAISATIAGVVGEEDAVDDDYMITGATQGSARVVLALQNALCGGPDGVVEDTAGGVVTADGTYTGSASGDWGNSFDVSVTIADSKITAIVIEDSSVVGTSGFDSAFNTGKDALIASLVGKTVADVVALEEYTKDNTLTSGATNSSNAFLAAVQDALTVEGTTYTGSASGDWGNSFDVTVTVADGEIIAIVIEDSSVVGTGGFDSAFNTGKDALVASLVGQTVADATALADYTKDNTLTSGATNSSNAFLAAVQDALSKIAD